MKKSVFILGFLVGLYWSCDAQKMKTKEIKKALEQGKVTSIELLIGDTFTPGNNLEFDLRVTLENGTILLASEAHVIWEYADVVVDNSPFKIRGEFLANGKGVLKPRDPSMYYPSIQARVAVDVMGKKAEKVLAPVHCYPSLVIDRVGSLGDNGDNGSNGYTGGSGRDGRDGEDGKPGPDILVDITEETIDGKPHIVVTLGDRHYPLDPSCSKVTIVTRGGNGGRGGSGGDGGDANKDTKGKYSGAGGRGGRGGDGGDGGNGGAITVTGSAYARYQEVVLLLSQGGEGGGYGENGDGGDGTTRGSRGSIGRSGSDGRAGQVIVKN